MGEYKGGWTWGKFCKETGYAPYTPITWFKKYGLEYTKIAGRPDNRNLLLDKPLKKLTKPETKFKLDTESRV